MSTLAPTLEAFFTERLIGQRCASPHTIAAYRDTFRLLLFLCSESNREDAVSAEPGGSRCSAGRNVSRLSGV